MKMGLAEAKRLVEEAMEKPSPIIHLIKLLRDHANAPDSHHINVLTEENERLRTELDRARTFIRVVTNLYLGEE